MNARSYAVVTGAYWAFTITDGALRMIVLLYFNELGYSPVALAMLFMLYELLGVFTNLIGGWVGARNGLKATLVAGLGLQIIALGALSLVSDWWTGWVAVAWVMFAQALSGAAKDLTKMSAKTAVKSVVGEGGLFRLVAILTGSKNALKGAGFFVGAALLQSVGFRGALWIMAAGLAVALLGSMALLGDIGRAASKPPIGAVLKKSAAINRLSLARFFLFGSRDIWFVVALPVFLDDVLGWSSRSIGAFLACWVIGYGIVQALAPQVLSASGRMAFGAYEFLLPMAALATIIAAAVWLNELQALITLVGLVFFGLLFALTSSVHSYLILAYSDGPDDTAMDVGYYYSANAAGRLVGTLLSGLLFVVGGFPASLAGTAVFLVLAFIVSLGLPELPSQARSHHDVAMS